MSVIYGNPITLGSSGGGIEFTVVGGTTLPSSPTENTVWVKTSTAINNVYVQINEPTSPAVGDVWVDTWVALDGDGNPLIADEYNMTISESPFIRISAKSGHQWNGAAWTQLPTRVYKNGAWSPDALIILMCGAWGALGAPTKTFRNGSEYGSPSTYLSFENGDLCYQGGTSTYTYRAYIETPINVGLYNKMVATLYVPSYGKGWVFLNTEIKSGTTSYAETYKSEVIETGTAASPIEQNIDISSATGTMYFGLGLNGSSSSKKPVCYFREITLTV